MDCSYALESQNGLKVHLCLSIYVIFSPFRYLQFDFNLNFCMQKFVIFFFIAYNFFFFLSDEHLFGGFLSLSFACAALFIIVFFSQCISTVNYTFASPANNDELVSLLFFSLFFSLFTTKLQFDEIFHTISVKSHNDPSSST